MARRLNGCGHVDNANALPTCPQPQQQTQKLVTARPRSKKKRHPLPQLGHTPADGPNSRRIAHRFRRGGAKKKSEAVLSDLVTSITKHLKKGNRLRIVGLGILQVRHRAARKGRNPATGEAIKIKASKKVAFRAAKDLKEAV